MQIQKVNNQLNNKDNKYQSFKANVKYLENSYRSIPDMFEDAYKSTLNSPQGAKPLAEEFMNTLSETLTKMTEGILGELQIHRRFAASDPQDKIGFHFIDPKNKSVDTMDSFNVNELIKETPENVAKKTLENLNIGWYYEILPPKENPFRAFAKESANKNNHPVEVSYQGSKYYFGKLDTGFDGGKF